MRHPSSKRRPSNNGHPRNAAGYEDHELRSPRIDPVRPEPRSQADPETLAHRWDNDLASFREKWRLPVMGALLNWLTGGPRPRTFTRLTFENVIAYFVKENPGDPRIQSGALLRYSQAGGYLVFQVFLDADQQLCCDGDRPMGRRLIAETLDPEFEAPIRRHRPNPLSLARL